jgi:4-hydroxy-tetrahydrodipicolinate synthase
LRTSSETIRIGELELTLVRPEEPESLLDEEAFADDEFMPYWAELWPAGLALARELPERLEGTRIVELGCGLGVPSLVAAARGAHVTAVDWAADAIALLRENAARNNLSLGAVHADWRRFDGSFDLALAADVLYEARNVEPLAGLLSRIAPRALVGLAGRPYERELLERVRRFALVREHRNVVHIELDDPEPRTADEHEPRVTTIPRVLGSVLTAIATPFHENAKIDFDAFQRLAQHLVDHGSDGLVVVGTTGESPTLSDSERNDLIRAALEAVGERATVVAATGTYSTRHSVCLTEEAHELGVDAVLVVTPYYNKPPQRGIVAHFEEVAKATDRPVVVYNIPSRVVVNIEPETITRLAEIDNVRAVKQANDDLAQARHIVATGLDLYAGDDNLFLPFLELGGVGGICVHTHVVGPQVAEQARAVREGDLQRAREIDRELAPVYDLLRITTNPIPIKAALNLTGHEVGSCRLPLVPPTDDELAQVRDCLARLGLLVAA